MGSRPASLPDWVAVLAPTVVTVLLVAALGVARVVIGLVRPPSALARSSVRSVASCGVERWSVKTLTDPAARRVNFHPRPTTVAALRRLRPTGYGARSPGVEMTSYRVRARLVETKLEEDDDYHLVVADLRHPSQTMIVEFPASNCTRHAAAVRRRQMVRARAAFVRACGYPSSSSFTYLRGTATITGVGFFDFPHGQTGVAPNAIELHPVLTFTHVRCIPA